MPSLKPTGNLLAPPPANSAYWRLDAPGVTPWIPFFQTNICATAWANGSCTSVTGVIERSGANPDPTAGGPGACPVKADSTGLSGNPSSAGSILPLIYEEPGYAWWRFNISAMTGTGLWLFLSGTTG
jgi:hypothetical protein